MFIIDNEFLIRLGCFLAVFCSMSVWEMAAPKRMLTVSKRLRWMNNLMITFLNSIAVRLIFPAAAIGIVSMSNSAGWGIFNVLPVPALPAGLLSLVLLDLAIYSQHALFHKVTFFWRVHRMHHTDLDIDVTTGARFHTIEILLSMGIKIAVIVFLGSPVWSVLAFEVLLNATSMFNHSNISIPVNIDSILRKIVVTPDMHRVHHSIVIQETNSNFGFNFPWWDRLFGTYRDQPLAGHMAMVIGLTNFRDAKYLTLPWMLVVPFLGM